jgi:hypothetical protein
VRIALASLDLLLVSLLSVVLLAKSLGPAIEAAVQIESAPLAVVGIIRPNPDQQIQNCSTKQGGARDMAEDNVGPHLVAEIVRSYVAKNSIAVESRPGPDSDQRSAQLVDQNDSDTRR